jgi:hypothetical protein
MKMFESLKAKICPKNFSSEIKFHKINPRHFPTVRIELEAGSFAESQLLNLQCKLYRFINTNIKKNFLAKRSSFPLGLESSPSDFCFKNRPEADFGVTSLQIAHKKVWKAASFHIPMNNFLRNGVCSFRIFLFVICKLGVMLWSLFWAIFTNFMQKLAILLCLCYDAISAEIAKI